jgi:hypothetical protein
MLKLQSRQAIMQSATPGKLKPHELRPETAFAQ